MPEYIAIIFDIGEQAVEKGTIAEAAEHFLRVWGDEAVLEIRRADYRDSGS